MCERSFCLPISIGVFRLLVLRFGRGAAVQLFGTGELRERRQDLHYGHL